MSRQVRARRKWHIRPRVSLMLIALLLVIFASVFVAFNMYIQGYIETTVRAQLSDITDYFRHQPGGAPEDKHLPPEDELPDITWQPKNKLRAEGEVFAINDRYEVMMHNMHEDNDEVFQIAEFLKSSGIAPADVRYTRVSTERGEYYVSAVEEEREEGGYLVFYVDVSGINSLVHTINAALGIIVAIAMAIGFWVASIIAASVTRPAEKLSHFAEEIGKGNFRRQEHSFADIEFCELAETMNETAATLERYDKDQRTFFQNASHELRTPLMSIRCYAEGIECGLMDGKEAGATIISETDRLTELVEDILYISRVDAIADQVEMKEGDLRDTLALSASALQPMADKRGLRINYDFDENPVELRYNEKHMYRAFANLIGNAVRYAESEITLRCTAEGGAVVASVTDDGAGIPQDELEHVFERFYKGRDGKHGIGLSIVKSVAQMHGGEVTVSCNGGTTFSIELRPET